jgi:protein SCO1
MEKIMKMKFFIGLSAALLLSALNANAFDSKTFYAKKCLSCHSIGGGDGKGPDFVPVFTAKKHGNKVKAKKHTNTWLIKFLKYPDGMINGDSDEKGYEKVDAHAKDLWAHFKKKVMDEVELSDGDMKSLIKYIEKMAKDVKAKKASPLKSK